MDIARSSVTAPRAFELASLEAVEFSDCFAQCEREARELVALKYRVAIQDTPADACWSCARTCKEKARADKEIAGMAVLLALRVPGLGSDPGILVTLGAALRWVNRAMAARVLKTAIRDARKDETAVRAHTSLGAVWCDFGEDTGDSAYFDAGWAEHKRLLENPDHAGRRHLQWAAERSARLAGAKLGAMAAANRLQAGPPIKGGKPAREEVEEHRARLGDSSGGRAIQMILNRVPAAGD